ncbi:ChaB family protein [Asticcacaulis sp.]|uniref:ChaB family protein n=1 Tax=Asticcacaulis sp. TaxID=1872648 RepID=UPI002B73A864|nr:ChaB family protein [Asticcacaulis sp.]HTM82812.1 ChaB family protein [Asticcacaulis sp.]
MTETISQPIEFECIASGEDRELSIICILAGSARARASPAKTVAYTANEDLPDEIRHSLPLYIQTLYREIYNHTWAHHVMPLRRSFTVRHDEAAKRAAWAAVRRLYVQREGTWVRRTAN